MTDEAQTLPRDVTRPLFGGAVALALFLAGFVAWSVVAPLSTTLHLKGQIVSSQPSFDLQHPYGGQVAEVLVSKHDEVKRGDLVMRLDIALYQDQLAHLSAALDLVTTENRVISAILRDDVSISDFSEAADTPALLRRDQADLQEELRRASAEDLKRQAEALRTRIAHSEAQLESMRERSERQDALVSQGIFRLSEKELLLEQMLTVQGQIAGDRASLHALEARIGQESREARLVELSLRETLSSTFNRNLARIKDLERQIAELEDRIARSEIRAPIDGTVTELYFEAEGMYAGRGATLVSLSQPLDQPHVSFSVPVAQIDQLRTGMVGRLVIESLPQRMMPRINVFVTALSPRAETDEFGNPTAYSGLAQIEPESFETLRASLEDVELTEDMPASLVLEARQTTLAGYLLGPFLAAFENALQD